MRKKCIKIIKEQLIPIIFIFVSVITGIVTNEIGLGIIIAASGLLNAWYASLGKSYNYIFGAIYCMFSAYVTYTNGLYGMTLFTIFVYFPSQILGWISWNKQKNKDSEVKIRRFNLLVSLIVTFSCIIGSFGLGLILSKIPGQQLAFLDASSNIITVSGIILMYLRYRECWWVWLTSYSIDVAIWTLNVINHNANSKMMLFVSIGYLLINVYGLIMWGKFSEKNKRRL